MERKYLKWTSYIAVGLMVLAILGAVLYLFLPLLINHLTGTEGLCSTDCYDYPPEQPVASLCDLCLKSQIYLGGAIMIMLLVSSVVGFMAVVLTTIDIFSSSTMPGSKKVLWLAALWLLLGFGMFTALAYVFIERKE